MTLLENLMVAQHITDARLRLDRLGLFGAPVYRAAERQPSDRARHWLKPHRPDRPRRRCGGNLPYGDQRRSKSRAAMCTDRRCSASMNPQPASTRARAML